MQRGNVMIGRSITGMHALFPGRTLSGGNQEKAAYLAIALAPLSADAGKITLKQTDRDRFLSDL
jgi:hypothetical protein